MLAITEGGVGRVWVLARPHSVVGVREVIPLQGCYRGAYIYYRVSVTLNISEPQCEQCFDLRQLQEIMSPRKAAVTKIWEIYKPACCFS